MMMRATILIQFIVATNFAYSQDCSCRIDTILNDRLLCDTMCLDNGAKLLWNFNCDSSWIIFENCKKERRQIFSLVQGLKDYMGRLGYVNFIEYQNTLLAQYNIISGCCSPPEYHLFNKETGRIKRKLGRILYYTDNKESPFVIGITDSNYDNDSSNFSSLTIYNVELDKEFIFELPKDEIRNALIATGELYPEYLFHDPVAHNNVIILTYSLVRSSKNINTATKTIIIDLDKYRT